MACGHKLSPPGAAEPAPQERPAPRDEARPEGERRQATVLFSDLSGYTAMNERLDPEEVQALMRRLKDRAVEIVEAHGGMVNQFVGDEVLALFGIPAAHEEDPVRAVRVALELHGMVQALSPEVEGKIGRPLRLHTGINTGLIVTSTRDARDGAIGVTGDTVNVGARLKALAADDQILLSPETARQVSDFFESAPLEPAALKGKAIPVRPHRLVSQTAVRTRFDASARRGLTPITGRDRELAMLHRCLERTIAGQGQFVTVVGEAGVGKSRLLFEFRKRVDRDRATVLEGRCQSYGTEIPYHPLLDALRRGLHLRDEDDPAERLGNALTNIRAIDPSLERYLPLYLHLLSIPSEQYPLPEGLQGEELGRAFEEALAAMFTLNARCKPMVVILEDWHWVDQASDAVLKYMLGLISSFSLMIVAVYRPEFPRTWSHLEQYTPIIVKRLDKADTETMIRSVLSVKTLPKDLADRIHERTGGNPLFIEEICKSLVEHGTLLVQEGGAVLTQDLDAVSLPDSVHSVIRTRVDRLDPDARDVLRLASVIGRDFSLAILEQMFPAQSRLRQALDALKAQELIHQVRVSPEAEFTFKHVLTQVVVFETLLMQQRKELHGRVGLAIERLRAGRLEEFFEALAFHFRGSADVQKAIQYLELAGDKAASAYSMQVANKHYWEAMQLLDALKMGGEQTQRRIDLSLKWAAAAFYTADEQQLKALQTSLELAETLNDHTRIVKTTNALGRIHYSKGNFGVAMTLFQRCIELAQAIEDQELLALPYNIVGRTCIFAGEFQKGIDYLRKGIPMMERQRNDGETAWSKSMLAVILGWVGELKEAIPLNQDAVELSRKTGNLISESAALCRFSAVLLLHGRFQETIRDCSQGLEISRQIGNQIVTGLMTSLQGFARFLSVPDREGISMMEEGIKLVESTGSHLALSFHYAWLAEAHALAGDTRPGLLAGERSLEILQFGERWGEAIARRALAMVSAGTTDPDWGAVDEHMQASLRLARERGERPNLALAHLRHAEILHKKGDLARARVEIKQASKLFLDMEMTWWGEQAEALRGRIEKGEPFRGYAPHLV